MHALATQFQHGGGDGGDARINTGACVVIQRLVFFQIIELYQCLFRAAGQVSRFRPGFTGA